MVPSCNSREAAKVTLWIAIPTFIFSVAMIFVFNVIYDALLKIDITIGEGTLVSKIWEDIPLPIYEKLYFFNITNEDSFLEGEPLNVTEVGPYTYSARWVKKHPQWNPNNTVSYREVRTYHFVPEMSNGTEDDIINTLNGPMIISSNIAGKIESFAKRMSASIALSGVFKLYREKLVTQKTIRELVYDGYDDVIMKFAPKIIQKDIPYKNGKFSWLYGKNASDDGLFTVFTGVDDASKTNIINNWNGQERLSFWKGNSNNETFTCNTLKSTSIETGPPINDDQETYTFFQSIFCRSLTFNYTEDITHYDISSKRFKSTRDLFANSTENPDNQCFEVNKEYASGILDVSPCQFEAPVFISFPHFLFADPSYLNNINGMKSYEQEHGSHIDVELITGISIDLAVRFQINMEVSKVPLIGQFHDIKDGIYPVFWAELSLKIDEHMANFLKRNVRLPKLIAYFVLLALAGISLLLVIVSDYFLTFCIQRRDDEQPLLRNYYANTDEPSYIPHERTTLSVIYEEYVLTDKSSDPEEFAEDIVDACNDISYGSIRS